MENSYCHEHHHVSVIMSLKRTRPHTALHSFPTRRSSDLPCGTRSSQPKTIDSAPVTAEPIMRDGMTRNGSAAAKDRKSTRLNSSHRCISYAVFCLKKKITKQQQV